MPELPEVEVTRLGIAPYLVQRRIVDVVVRQPQLRWPISADLPQQLQGRLITAINRRAKYLLFDCGTGILIVHLGMSGSLRLLRNSGSNAVGPDYPPEKHDHFDLVLEGQSVLRFRDPRRFGAILWQPDRAKLHPLLSGLGPEPLSKDFCAAQMYASTRGRKTSIKALLMNNKVVVGVGNIYANEALFHAKIHPRTVVSRIGLSRYETLVQSIKHILCKAIEAGGSSLRDFVGSNGKPGYFQQQYWVYGRSGEACRSCGTAIKHIRQGQRSSFYCSFCQR